MTNVVVNGNAYSDDGSAARDMNGGGHRTWLLPMIGGAMVGINGAYDAAAAAAASASLAASNAAGWSSNSTTSLTVGTGAKSLIIGAGRLFSSGVFVQIMRTSAPTTTYMMAQVTSYNSGTGALAVSVSNIAGSGTYTDWTVTLSGKQGADVTLPSQTGNAGKFLSTDGTAAIWEDPVAQNYQEFLTSATWTKPTGCQWVYVESIGGGGSGGAASTTNTNPYACGGGGGAFASRVMVASAIAASVSVTVGSGGVAAVSASAAGFAVGNNGGTSSFGSYLLATGGKGPSVYSYGGTGGGGEASSSISDIPSGGSYSSGAGGSIASLGNVALNGGSCVMGGAGGGAASAGAGASDIEGVGGLSGNGGGGGRGNVSLTTLASTGVSGSLPGGGGGGAVARNAVPGVATSGAGAAGRVRVWAW